MTGIDIPAVVHRGDSQLVVGIPAAVHRGGNQLAAGFPKRKVVVHRAVVHGIAAVVDKD
jgi:hypothetical protein